MSPRRPRFAPTLCSALLTTAALAAAPGAWAQPTDVFISEYIEGSSNNKALEIYNGTAGAIDLTAGSYVVQMFFNGSGTAGLTISLTGTVAAGDVFVLAQASANATILAQADQTNGSGWYNGDDAVVLRKGGAAGPVVDSLGQVGVDPGTEWGTGLTSTADNTLRRKTSVCQGDTSISDSYDPSIEWDGFATDTFGGLGAHTATCGGGTTLSVSDVSQAEGNSGTTTFAFQVNLSAPAGPGGVTFDIATADGTATVADNDFVAQTLLAQTIAAGGSTYDFNVAVNGDSTVEPNQTFFVNVTNVTGATVADGQGQGTIQNDDLTIVPIHDVQGPGASSPVVGAVVSVDAIVTGVRSNGFFVQEEDAQADADPATSEGILVFTGAAPPAAAAVGNRVVVTGTVAEFVPSQDPLQPPLTELTSPAVVLIASGNPLPAPVPLTATLPDPAGPHDQLERLEGMRVSLASLTVVGPTLGSISEPNATATTQGVFYGVVTGVPRPFREAGIQAPDPPPAGTIPPIPRFDSNPERIRVDSDGLVGSPALDVGTGAVVSNLVGPLDYSFRTYTILPDPGSTPTVSGGPVAAAITPPTSAEFTVGAYNLQRFFDTVNDPGIGEPVLTAAAFDARLDKASLGIRDFLRTPDVLGIVECENLSTLQALAARISADAIAAGQPDPEYDAFLIEGNDIGGIDVGFLVKAAPVAGATPRVEVLSVTQEGAGTLFVNPDASSELLNDRPSLVLDAIIHHANGAAFPIVAIVNHLRSLNGVADLAPGSNGWPTGGERVRAKRLQQAQFLANLVQARQTADPTEAIVLLGDFNAFEVNDGLGDSMAVIAGTPPPDNETAVPGDGGDLVNPDLDNLFDTAPPADRFSFVFDGNAQSLDHILINEDLTTGTLSRRIEHPRINADFPEVARNDFANVQRLADHDPIVAFFEVPGFQTAELSIAKTDSPDPATAGGAVTYTLVVDNAGPFAASSAALSDPLPAGVTFTSLASPAGWSCTTPTAGSGGTVACSVGSLAVGAPATFTIQAAIDPAVPAGTVLSNVAAVTSATADTDAADDTATSTTTVATLADLSLTKVDGVDPAAPGQDVVYTLTVVNAGPSAAAAASWSDTLPAGTVFRSLASPAGWSCTTPPVDGTGTVTCGHSAFAPGPAVFALTVRIDLGVPGGTVLTNTATLGAATPDPDGGDLVASAATTVSSPAAVTVSKTVDGDLVAGGNVVYTIVMENAGPNDQGDNPGDELTDTLPAELTLTGASADSGTVTTAGDTVSWNGAILAGGAVTITIEAEIVAGVPFGTVVVNQATYAYDADGDGANEASGVSDDPAEDGTADPTGFVLGGSVLEIPTLDGAGLAALALLLAALGWAALRRRGARVG